MNYQYPLETLARKPSARSQIDFAREARRIFDDTDDALFEAHDHGLAIFAALMEKKLGLSWGWTVAFGVLSILAGGFALMQPPVTLAAIIGLIGGFALVSGVLLLIGAFRLSAIARAIP